MWVDRDNLRLVRFIQSSKIGDRTMLSDIRVLGYKESGGSTSDGSFLCSGTGGRSGASNTATFASTRISAGYIRSGHVERIRFPQVYRPKPDHVEGSLIAGDEIRIEIDMAVVAAANAVRTLQAARQ